MEQRRTVLLIEDDPDDRFIFASLMDECFPGVELICSPDGQAALSMLESVSPDIIFTDLNMPKLDGRAFLRHYQALEDHLRQAPVIVLSTSDAPQEVADLLKSGAAHYVTKAQTFEQMSESIQEIFQYYWPALQ